MTPQVVIALLTMTIIVVVAFWVLWQWTSLNRMTKRASRKEPVHVKESMPIDPENPPSWKVYHPRKGAPGRACACHPDRALWDGQKVLWWPVPVSGGGVNVFCEDGVEVDA